MNSLPGEFKVKISIIIPVRNEEENIEKTVLILVNTITQYDVTKNHEIIIVNDNSNDHTGDIADRLSSNNSSIKVVHRKENPGFGNTLKAGYKKATGDILVPFMGDLSDDPQTVYDFIIKIHEGYDIIYGSRFMSGGRTVDYPPIKKFFNRSFNSVVGYIFKINAMDVTNAFKAYSREVIEAIGIDNIESKHFDITLELPIKAHILGFKSIEIPTSWHERTYGVSKFSIVKRGPLFIKRLFLIIIWNLFKKDVRKT